MELHQGKPNVEWSSNQMESPEKKKKKMKRLGSDGPSIKIMNDSAGSQLKPPPPASAMGTGDIKICGLCGKAFASAKALGGHMRVHFEAHNSAGGSSSKKADKSHLAKTKKKLYRDMGMASSVEIGSNINNPVITSNGDESQVCPVCGKGFPSDKSLHGHMRCHPERNWRGIQPPLTGAVAPSSATAKNVNSSSGSSYSSRDSSPDMGSSPSAVVDLFVAGWLVKGKRGQKGISDTWEENGKVVTDIGSDVDFSVPMAAHDLMELAQARPAGKGIMISVAHAEKRVIRSMENDDQDTDIINAVGSDYQDAINSASNCDQDTDIVGLDAADENTRERRRRRRRRRKAMELKSTKTEWDSDDEYWLGDHFPHEHQKGRKNCRVDLDLDQQPRHVPSAISHAAENTRRPSALNCTKKTKGTKIKLIRNTTAGSRENMNKVIDGELVGRSACRWRNKIIRKKKLHHNHNHNLGDESGSASDHDHDEQERTNGCCQQLVETPGPYKCRFCPKTFLTGQALGGHQRAHSNGAAASQDESQSQSQSQGN